MVKNMLDFNEIANIIVRSIVAIIVLFLITRILGKKQMSQLTIYDYVVGITIGSLAGDSIISLDKQFANGIISIITFGVIALLLSYLAMKNSEINIFLNGKPVILMENGEFIFDNLRSAKITVCKFIEQCRLKGYYDLSYIDYAILETDGEISFLPKADYQPTKVMDLKRNSKMISQSYCSNLIIDGEIQSDVLKELGKDDEWLRKELKKLKINSLEKILLVTIDQRNQIKVYKELM